MTLKIALKKKSKKTFFRKKIFFLAVEKKSVNEQLPTGPNFLINKKSTTFLKWKWSFFFFLILCLCCDEKYKIIRIGGHEIDDEGKIDVLIVHWSNLLKPTREKFRTSDWENNEVFKTYYVNICFYLLWFKIFPSQGGSGQRVGKSPIEIFFFS